MTDSNREQILEEFKTFLANITIDNGFNNDVSAVYRRMVSYDDPKNVFPLLMILGGGETFEDELGSYTRSSPFRIKIRGYSKDEEDPESALNSLIRDVLIILENSTYNTYHSSYKPISLDSDEGWLHTEANGLAMFELSIEISYRFLRSNP